MSDPDQEAIQVWTDPVWLVRVQESEAIVGPVSLDQIKRGIDKNKLAKDAEIALDGSDSWVAAVGHLKRVIRDFGGLTGARRRLGKYREPPPSVDMRGAPMADAPELEARPIAPRGARAGKCGRCGSSRVVRDAQLAVMGGASIVLQLATCVASAATSSWWPTASTWCARPIALRTEPRATPRHRRPGPSRG
jgi:hypothetical protein